MQSIRVHYDEETNHHHLEISFIMLLVGYGIKYKSKNTKDGYDLIDGQKHKEIGIKPSPRGKKSTPLLELLHSD